MFQILYTMTLIDVELEGHPQLRGKYDTLYAYIARGPISRTRHAKSCCSDASREGRSEAGREYFREDIRSFLIPESRSSIQRLS
jgi:hypothetical protein